MTKTSTNAIATINVNMDGIAVKEYKDASLTDIASYIKAGNEAMTTASSAILFGIAHRIARIDENKSFKEDGFKSAAQFLMSEFGYKKTMAYNMVKVGKEFIDKETGLLKEQFSGFNYGQIQSLVNKGLDTTKALEMLDSEMLNTSMSCREIENAITEYKTIDVDVEITDVDSSHEEKETETKTRTRKAVGCYKIAGEEETEFYSITELQNIIKSLASEKGTIWNLTFHTYTEDK